jgi:hypothetical protein
MPLTAGLVFAHYDLGKQHDVLDIREKQQLMKRQQWQQDNRNSWSAQYVSHDFLKHREWIPSGKYWSAAYARRNTRRGGRYST